MRLLYILAGIISFLAALLFTLPADKALQWWGDDLEADIRLFSPQGGVASGSARSVSIDGLLLDETNWRLRPLALLKGRLGFTLKSSVNGNSANAIVEFGMGGRTVIHDLHASLPIAQLLPLFGSVILPLSGNLQVDLSRIVIEDESLFELNGQIQVRSARWTLMRPTLLLGNFNAELSTQDQIMTAAISSDSKSPVATKGQVKVDNGGRYDVDLLVKANTNTDERLNNLLKSLGRPDAQGWYRVKTSGRL